MTPDCHPIAAKSRNYSQTDQRVHWNSNIAVASRWHNRTKRFPVARPIGYNSPKRKP